MVSNQNLKLGIFGALEWIIVVYFTTIWYTLKPFSIYCGHLVYFLPFWYIVPRNIWQPWYTYICRENQLTDKKVIKHSIAVGMKDFVLLQIFCALPTQNDHVMFKILFVQAAAAQWSSRPPPEHKVGGSSP
jgi:hypothetical protein